MPECYNVVLGDKAEVLSRFMPLDEWWVGRWYPLWKYLNLWNDHISINLYEYPMNTIRNSWEHCTNVLRLSHDHRKWIVRQIIDAFFTLYIKNTFSGEVTGSCWLFSSHFSYAWFEMKNQLLTFPNKSITLQQLSTL